MEVFDHKVYCISPYTFLLVTRKMITIVVNKSLQVLKRRTIRAILSSKITLTKYKDNLGNKGTEILSTRFMEFVTYFHSSVVCAPLVLEEAPSLPEEPWPCSVLLVTMEGFTSFRNNSSILGSMHGRRTMSGFKVAWISSSVG